MAGDLEFGPEVRVVIAGSEPIKRDAFDRVSIRAVLAKAMATLDSDQVADALFEIIQRSFSTVMTAIFVVRDGEPVELKRFAVDDPNAEERLDSLDFDWIQPLLVSDVSSGASEVSLEVDGVTQIASVIAFDGESSTVLFVAGAFERVYEAQRQLSNIASESGEALRLLSQANQLAADNAAERERERLSRDLHDSLSQSLWSLSILAQTAQQMTQSPGEVHDLIRRIASISLASQEQMRSLLINLRNDEPTRSSVLRTLEGVVASFRADHDIEVIAAIADVDLEVETVTALQRITEEALNNVSRHAHANSVSVSLDANPVTLRIRDDGLGFTRARSEGHLGLRIMEERTAEIGYSFEVSSSAAEGTSITVCADPARLRPVSSPKKRAVAPSLRKALWLVATGVALVAMAFGLFFASGSQRSDAAEADVELELLATTRTHVDLVRASSSEASARILAAVGIASQYDIMAAQASRDAVIDQSRQDLEVLAGHDSRAGERSMQVLDRLDDAAAVGAGGDRLGPLLWEASTLELFLPSGRTNVTPLQSVTSVAAFEQMLGAALFETALGVYALERNAYSAPDDVDAFFMGSIDFMERAGGYLGPDPSEPLASAYLSDVAATVHEGPAMVRLNRAVAQSGMWEADQWVRQWSPSSGPLPMTLDEYVEGWAVSTARARTIVDERFDLLETELAAPRDDALRWAARLQGLGIAALVLGGLGLGWALLFLIRRGRSMAADRSLDPLTGVASRRELEEVAQSLADPALTHHVMVAVGMDQFKVVNELHGRSFGDRLLQVTARGLESIALDHGDITCFVIRLAGDEFLLSMHSSEEICPVRIRLDLERVRGTLVSADDGTMVRCHFSYGLASAEGSPDLDRLMSASDLDAYEDKSRRETRRLNELTASATSLGN